MSTCGDKNIKRTRAKQQHDNHNFECLYYILVNHHICVIFQCNVHHIESWNHPKSIHKSRFTSILISGWPTMHTITSATIHNYHANKSYFLEATTLT